MAIPNVFSGGRSRFLIGGVPVGFASGVSYSESYDFQPVDTLDFLEVREYVPTAYRTTLSAQIFRVIGKSLKALGIFSKLSEVLTSGDLTCAVEDTLTGNIAAQFLGVKCSEHSGDVTARGVTSENVTFVCVKTVDEAELPLA